MNEHSHSQNEKSKQTFAKPLHIADGVERSLKAGRNIIYVPGITYRSRRFVIIPISNEMCEEKVVPKNTNRRKVILSPETNRFPSSKSAFAGCMFKYCPVLVNTSTCEHALTYRHRQKKMQSIALGIDPKIIMTNDGYCQFLRVCRSFPVPAVCTVRLNSRVNIDHNAKAGLTTKTRIRYLTPN